jgi:hypothetical protein
MQRLPVNLATHPEIYAQLVKKVWLTVADLSDSFFQMMLKAKCQALTAFYSEGHGKLYCFTRCPQGLKNSPLHLKLLLDTNHKKDKNRTYKNQARVSKTFELGQIVAHRQLQLATGPNMSMEPKFDGPYTIMSFDKDSVSARIKNLDTGRQMRAHFTNMMPINFHPSANMAQTNFDNQLADISPMLPDRFTIKSKSL